MGATMTKPTAHVTDDRALPIVDITLESATADGREVRVWTGPDLDDAEVALWKWASAQVGHWPDGAPLRVSVEFPRRLVFTTEILTDGMGRVRPEDGPTLTLRDHLSLALREALAMRPVSVAALCNRRTARIVLPYGDPFPPR